MIANQEKILIIGPAWVGDMVMAQTLFLILKQQADVIIDVLAPNWSGPLLERFPQVRRFIPMPLGHGELNIRKRYQIAKELKIEKYDRAIVLPNSWKSALVPFFAGIPKRVGWCGEFRYGLLNDIRILNKKNLPLMIQRFIALGLPKEGTLPKELPQPQFKINEHEVKTALNKYGLENNEKPILAICPGAEYGPAKRWPEKYFAEVSEYYIKQGWQVWILGSAKDEMIANSIQKNTTFPLINLTGKTTLAEAIDLLSLAKIVVTNDSGLMHMAAALQRPMVVVYGSSDPKFTPPLSEKVKILNLGLNCSPCFKRECPLGHLKCLQDLYPEKVLQAMNELMVECEF